jgi:hypothetical protein
MTTFIPRQFYSEEEIEKLYPKELELQLVQIVRVNHLTQSVYRPSTTRLTLCSSYVTAKDLQCLHAFKM